MPEVVGFPRKDGRFGIRNHLLVLYTVECARTVAEGIAARTRGRVLGFPGCYANPAAYLTLLRLGTHPNVGGALVVALGCEHTDYRLLAAEIEGAGTPSELLVIQETGGSPSAVRWGVRLGRRLKARIRRQRAVRLPGAGLVVGLECGGSDATSGLISNPALGYAVDRLIAAGGTAIAEEMTEMLGAEDLLALRCDGGKIEQEIQDGVGRARRYSNVRRQFAISPGNVSGGLTTIEEKSLGAVMKTGRSPIRRVLRPGQTAAGGGGLHILDRTPDPDTRLVCMCGGGDATGLTDLAAAGAHLIVFTTGRGTPVGHAVAPVIKVCGNPETCARMGDNIDVKLDGYFRDEIGTEEAGEAVLRTIQRVASGGRTRAEMLGHREYWVEYKYGQPGAESRG